MKLFYWLSITCIVCFMSGCSLLSTVPTHTQNTYIIKTLPPVQTKKTRRPITLLVRMPNTRAFYDTNLMAYSTKPYQIDYYAKSTWLDRPGSLLQPLIIQSLQNTHYFHAVTSPSAGGDYQYSLTLQIETFLQDYTHGHAVFRLVAHANVIRSSSNRIMATKEFVINQPMLQASPYGGVVAANQATANMLRQLTRFCLKTL